MRKNLYLKILILFFVLFRITDVYAAGKCVQFDGDKDHSLNYEISTFSFDGNNKLTIGGWAFVHNYNNYGGKKPNNYSYTWKNGDSYSGTNVANLSVFLRFEAVNNENLAYEHEVDNYNNLDLSEVMKYNNFNSRYYIYDNVGFTTVINLDDVYSEINKSDIGIKIYAKLDCTNGNGEGTVETKKVDLAVYKGIVTNGNFENLEIKNLSDKLEVSGNHVVIDNYISGGKIEKKDNGGVYSYFGNENNSLSCNKDGCYSRYWKNTTSNDEFYTIFDRGEEKISNVTMSKFLVGWQGSNSYTSSNNIFKVCGFNWVEEIESDLGNWYQKCNYPCHGNNCTKSWISVRFVTINGGVILKYKGNKDIAVCEESGLDSQKTINNCDGSVNYFCGGMTVEAGVGISAKISISESATLDSIDTFNKKVLAGRGFGYEMTYTDVVEWKILDRSYSGTSNDYRIENKVLSMYYNYNRDTLQQTLQNSVKDVSKASDYGDKNFSEAGSWTCDDYKRSVSGGTYRYTVTCSYKLKKANINYHTGKIVSYDDGGTGYLNGGNRYYVPMLYSNDSDFKWNILTNINSSISLLKVSYNKENLNKTKAPDINIDTGSNNNNTCYINVVNDFYDVEDSDGPGSKVTVKGYKFVYRSISVDNPFPSYAELPQNWKIYSDTHGGLDRLFKSYNDAPVYVTKSNVKNNLSGEFDYTDRSDVDISGRVKEVVNNTYFEKIPGAISDYHCKLGEFSDGCDKR